MTTGFSSSWGRKFTSGVSRTKSLSSSAAAITGEEGGEGGEGGERREGERRGGERRGGERRGGERRGGERRGGERRGGERRGEEGRGGERRGGEKSDVTLQTTTEYGLFISDSGRVIVVDQVNMVTCRRLVAVISSAFPMHTYTNCPSIVVPQGFVCVCICVCVSCVRVCM